MRKVRENFEKILPGKYADISLVVFGALGLMNHDMNTLRDLGLRFGEFDGPRVDMVITTIRKVCDHLNDKDSETPAAPHIDTSASEIQARSAALMRDCKMSCATPSLPPSAENVPPF